MLENHPKSFSEGAQERKRKFSANAGLTIVKPCISRSEASQNEVILERKSVRAPPAARGRKNSLKKCGFCSIWRPKRSVFRAKTASKNEANKKSEKHEKGIPERDGFQTLSEGF